MNKSRDLRVPARRTGGPLQLSAAEHIISYSLHPCQKQKSQIRKIQRIKKIKTKKQPFASSNRRRLTFQQQIFDRAQEEERERDKLNQKKRDRMVFEVSD